MYVWMLQPNGAVTLLTRNIVLFNSVIRQYCTPACYMDLSYMSVASVHCCSLPYCCLWLRTWNYLQWLSCQLLVLKPITSLQLMVLCQFLLATEGKKCESSGWSSLYANVSFPLFSLSLVISSLLSSSSHSRVTFTVTHSKSNTVSFIRLQKLPPHQQPHLAPNKWKSLSLNSYVWHKFSVLEFLEWTDHL